MDILISFKKQIKCPADPIGLSDDNFTIRERLSFVGDKIIHKNFRPKNKFRKVNVFELVSDYQQSIC